MTTVSGSVDRIVFRNADTGFCVLRFQLADRTGAGEATTVVGTLPAVRVGEMLRLTGEWTTHAVHGRNFRVDLFEEELPSTPAGIERYLASGAIHGIGPVTAGRIVDAFGDQAIQVIEETPELLRTVAGISAKRLEVITASWREQSSIRELSMFLQEHGISVALAARIYAAYGDSAADTIRSDPYRLAHDVHGIGFKTADAVAGKLGVSRRSPSRYLAGLKYVLSRATEEGHVFLHRDDLLERASGLLDAPREALEPTLLELIHRGDAVLEGDVVFLTPFHVAESGLARLIHENMSTPSALTLDPRFDAVAAAAAAGEAQGLALAEKQTLAVQRSLQAKISILTGGPGTGKTSTLRTVITALEAADISFCLCAPTGRAAKRVAETTGRPASTIHRLLEFAPATMSYGYDHARPLPYDFVIVDEVSMLDTLLAYHLFKAIPPESHVLLVGDADQLPAVGPGNILRDLVASDAVPTTVLTDLFRQAQGSQIVTAAHAVNRGVLPELRNGPEDDLFFMRSDSEEDVVAAIKGLVADRIPRRYGLDPVEDIQVLSPMHRGPAGVAALNEELQELLNPARGGRAQLTRGTRILRVGDKVMQVRNNYEKDIYNGDVGRITDIDVGAGAIMVEFGTGIGSVEVPYEGTEVDQLTLAYAVSVHKAQGSEFPCVVMPLVTRHFVLLERHLLYTAITRARRLCVLVGTPRALSVGVSTNRGARRNTDLARRLAALTGTQQLELA